ncbi:hypothetical protein ACQVQE_29910 [Bacillus mycoides]
MLTHRVGLQLFFYFVWNLGLEYIAIINNSGGFFYKMDKPKLFWLKSNVTNRSILDLENARQKAIQKFQLPH